MTTNFVQEHNRVVSFQDAPKVIIVDGPRGAGKTVLIDELVKISPIFAPIKFRQFIPIDSVSHPDASLIRMDYLLRFIGQLPFELEAPIPIFDRFIGTEIVMSRITNRAVAAQLDQMWELDELAARFAIQIILRCEDEERYRRTAERKAEGPSDLLNEYWGGYSWRTKIKTLIIDTTNITARTAAVVAHGFISSTRSDWHKSINSSWAGDPGVILGDAPMP